jgi:hypothetical protein
LKEKKFGGGKPKKRNKIKGKILFYFIYFNFFFFEKNSGDWGPAPPSPHVGPPLLKLPLYLQCPVKL